MSFWDGKWWAESLEHQDREKYDALVRRIKTAPENEREGLCRELFQFGHEHGYELACELHRD